MPTLTNPLNPHQIGLREIGMNLGQTVAMTVVDTRRAMDLEALLHWAVAREMADLALAGDDVASWLASSRSGDGCATILRRFEVGDAGVSGGISAAGAAMAHQDAVLVWALVLRELESEGPALELVRACARAGERPDWGQRLPVVQLKPELVWKGGKWRVQEKAMPGGRRWCVLRLKDNAEELRRRRTLYRIWWQAMGRLADVMAEAPLLTRRCTGLKAEERPWEQLAA